MFFFLPLKTRLQKHRHRQQSKATHFHYIAPAVVRLHPMLYKRHQCGVFIPCDGIVDLGAVVCMSAMTMINGSRQPIFSSSFNLRTFTTCHVSWPDLRRHSRLKQFFLWGKEYVYRILRRNFLIGVWNIKINCH